MAVLIGVVSQKGGVGKSMISRLLAMEYARVDWNVLIADMDSSQSTSYEWNLRRQKNKVSPLIHVERFIDVEDTIQVQESYDLVIFDGAPHASRMTKSIANIVHLLLLPTGNSIDDLNPQIRLAHELVNDGINKNKLAFVLSRVGNSHAELDEVLNYLNQTGYMILSGHILEKTAFRQAVREGRSISETRYIRLTNKCEEVVQSVADRIDYLTK
ncbi:MAG: ParA family protein [Candidatus Cardinium sp.]|uniref:ParA family protein n=1 Tax=Cardinium endosymbiont of Dermatophagoides farinae TaxID=2597823 RepID=UPI0011831486|nr:ParA family protein [Cardinium endosymbiont of Dermatophagoides farinae]TSJ81151.1 ParA family protein [Cardinium endosymbiont of Dermatophagoides farinae]UWW97199.1 MAG: ParA family protein [Candidatus Cardinium sp.]